MHLFVGYGKLCTAWGSNDSRGRGMEHLPPGGLHRMAVMASTVLHSLYLGWTTWVAIASRVRVPILANKVKLEGIQGQDVAVLWSIFKQLIR